MTLILVLLVLQTAACAYEMIRHNARRRRIPIRIHVNGSRGKSSVTRLIAAGLREGGVRTLAKTTGSAARVIFPDGSEMPVRRRGGPNIREQLRIFRRAEDSGVKAIVLECMAIQPHLQWTCEHQIVKSTIGVITNVRPDHLEEMGPTVANVAESLANTIPTGSLLITSEKQYASLFEERAKACGSRVERTDPTNLDRKELDGFDYVEFDENVSLALAVCRAVGIDRDSAIAGMWKVKPDRGALVRRHIREAGRNLEFVNLFAANDPQTTAFVWEHMGLPSHENECVVLMNIRSDRMRRSIDLARLFERQIRACRYVLVGELTVLFADILRRNGVPINKVIDLGGRRAEEIWSALLAMTEGRLIVVGVGNVYGVGGEFLDLIESKEQLA